MAEQQGKWITLDNGVHIFIKDGQTLEDAMKEKLNGEIHVKNEKTLENPKQLQDKLNGKEKNWTYKSYIEQDVDQNEKEILEKKYGDYNTQDVERYSDGKIKPNIFDTTQTGWEAKDREAQDKKNIIMMTPNQYFELCEEGFGVPAYEQIKNAKNDKVVMEYLTEVITKKGKKLQMPYIDMNNPEKQEGRHRMAVAGELFGWNKSFPVLATNNSKTKLLNPTMKEILEKKFKGYKIHRLNVSNLVKENKLRENNSTLNTRKGMWGNSYDDYKFDEAQYNYNQTDPIRIAKVGNEYKIENGSHRLIALENAGYKYADILMIEYEK